MNKIKEKNTTLFQQTLHAFLYIHYDKWFFVSVTKINEIAIIGKKEGTEQNRS